jgi:hypothetical protein
VDRFTRLYDGKFLVVGLVEHVEVFEHAGLVEVGVALLELVGSRQRNHLDICKIPTATFH